MTMFGVIIICTKLASCPWPIGYSFDHFEAENRIDCQKSVRLLVGGARPDLIVICSIETEV